MYDQQDERQKNLFEDDINIPPLSYDESNTPSKRPLISPLKHRKLTIPVDIALIFLLTLFISFCVIFFCGVHHGRKLSKREIIDNENNIFSYVSHAQVEQKAPSFRPPPSQPFDASDTKEMTRPSAEPYKEKPLTSLAPLSPSSSPSLEDVPTYRYTIRVASSKDKKSTEKMLSELKDKGIDARIEERESKKGTIWYIIFVGRFRVSKDGRDILKNLKENEGFKDAYFEPL